MKVVYERPKTLEKVTNHYCPGCHHGILHALIAEVLDEMGLAEKAVGVAPVGCAVLAYNYLDIDWIEAPHGRAVAIATGIKLAHPDVLVFTYQGDGDAAAIGLAETMYGAIRGVNVTTFLYNNAIYGMTGGQMAPTTLLGMKTTTSPYGRDAKREGYPLKMAETIALQGGTAFSARTALFNPKMIMETKKRIRQVFELQMKGAGFTFLEVVGTCPTNWGMSPVDATKFAETEMVKTFPLGVYKELKEVE
ncbi:2-oxoglutarate oxidoreductase [Coprothermobacteraceae bacterium]|nr:2-oxoglutarate oxidoreductase [Coprothermobacteraceae bacterium]